MNLYTGLGVEYIHVLLYDWFCVCMNTSYTVSSQHAETSSMEI